MKLRGLVPNFHIHVSVSDTYVPTIGPPIFWEYLFQIFCTVKISRLRTSSKSSQLLLVYKHLLCVRDVVSRTILFDKIELFFLLIYVHTQYGEVGVPSRELIDL
jgi:hypothetical protein